MKKFTVILSGIFLGILLVLLSVLAHNVIWVNVVSVVAVVIWAATAIPFYRSKQTQPFKNASQELSNQPSIGKVVEQPARSASFPTKIIYDLQMVQALRNRVDMLELENSTPDIRPDRFKMTGNHTYEARLELQPCSAEDDVNEVANRLQSEGFVLEGTIELSSFLNQYPEEVSKWGCVLAIHEDARWINPSNETILLPCASVRGKSRCLGLAYSLKDGGKIGVNGGILVSRIGKGKMILRS